MPTKPNSPQDGPEKARAAALAQAGSKDSGPFGQTPTRIGKAPVFKTAYRWAYSWWRDLQDRVHVRVVDSTRDHWVFYTEI